MVERYLGTKVFAYVMYRCHLRTNQIPNLCIYGTRNLCVEDLGNYHRALAAE